MSLCVSMSANICKPILLQSASLGFQPIRSLVDRSCGLLKIVSSQQPYLIWHDVKGSESRAYIHHITHTHTLAHRQGWAGWAGVGIYKTGDTGDQRNYSSDETMIRSCSCACKVKEVQQKEKRWDDDDEGKTAHKHKKKWLITKHSLF